MEFTIYWQSFADFINMGGKSFYVWGAFIVVVLAILIEIVYLKINAHKSIAFLRRKYL